jgi:hypothetical protein
MSDNPTPDAAPNKAGDNFNDNPLMVLLVLIMAVGSAALFDITFAIVVAVFGALFFLALGERRRIRNQGE